MYNVETHTLVGTAGARKLPVRLHALMDRLLSRPNHVFSYDALIGSIWPNPDDEPEDAGTLVKIYIHHLRAALREVSAAAHVETVRGAGYVLRLDRVGHSVYLSDQQWAEVRRLLDTHPNADLAAHIRSVIEPEGSTPHD